MSTDEKQPSNIDPWQQHRLEQMMHFRSLPLRQKMQAIEELAEVARRLKKIKTQDEPECQG
jgi:hypothetical protein